MADVKWIKIYTDMINNKKIKRIRKMPEGNNTVLIWFFLLMQVGESNKNGGLFLTDTIPFTEEDLAIEFDFDISVIKLALLTLEKFSMIDIYEDIIYIKNWEEYQNTQGLEKIREQTKLRVARYRENQKLLGNAKCNVTVTQSNATDKELEIEIDKELNTSCPKNKFSDESLPIILSQKLFTRIKSNNPKAKEPNIQVWAKHIDLMLRIDKRTSEEIEVVIDWCQQDNFWYTNILSTDKLRKQYDRLVMEMNKKKPQLQQQPKTISFMDLV